MGKYAVVTGVPVKKVRNFENRNAKKMRRRMRRLEEQHGTLIQVMDDAGTLRVYTEDNVVHEGNVKRDAERHARKVDGTFVTL